MRRANELGKGGAYVSIRAYKRVNKITLEGEHRGYSARAASWARAVPKTPAALGDYVFFCTTGAMAKRLLYFSSTILL